MNFRSDIDSFYDFANITNNDLEFISFLLQLLKLKSNITTIKNLENLKVAKYENDFNFLLDNLRTETIKDLKKIYDLQKAINGNEH